MTSEKLVHVIFNTGSREETLRRNFRFPNLQRANAGVDIDSNIILQLTTCADRNRAAYIGYYEATFSCGTYTNKEPFLISYGTKNREIARKLWPMRCKDMDDDYGIRPPVDCPPATPAVIDVFLPCKHLEVAAYLYKFNCYDFCADLGWALFHPNSMKL